MIATNNSAGKSACLIAFALGCTACADEPRSLTAPTSIVGTVTGSVHGETPRTGRFNPGHLALSNATVTVIGGPASGTKATTGADGMYEIAGADTFKLRFEHPSFLASESIETTVTTGNAKISIPQITLKTAPWTISGRITDRLGSPVPDAEVAAGYHSDSFFIPAYGQVRTDTAGRYVIDSTMPHFETLVLWAGKPGFRPLDSTLFLECCGNLPDIRLGVRVISITPTAPTSLRVGEAVRIPACVVVLDTGETRNIEVAPTSSAPAVVSVDVQRNFEMRGVAPGVATLTFEQWGAVATLQVIVR